MTRVLFLIIAFTNLSIFAQTPSPEDGPRTPEPVYLMPISAYRPLKESVGKLLGHRWGHATMIYVNGVTNEEDCVVSVWGADNKPKTLTLIRFVPTGNYGEQAKSKSEINAPIDQDFADAIHEAWSVMLMKTRYPEKIPVVADGWTAEFSAWVVQAGAAYGVNDSGGGFSDELMHFGFELRDYCEAKGEDRKESATL